MGIPIFTSVNDDTATSESEMLLFVTAVCIYHLEELHRSTPDEFGNGPFNLLELSKSHHYFCKICLHI